MDCWGYNDSDGELGNGTIAKSSLPVPVSNTSGTGPLTGALALSYGEYHGCVLIAGGQLECWGFNNSGQIGTGNKTPILTPRVVVTAPATPLTGVVAVTTGSSHTCAVILTGGVDCWGYNSYGQVGTGTTGPPVLTPSGVIGLAGPVRSVAASYDQSCALLTNGTEQCWGGNDSGQLGFGYDSTHTVQVAPGGNGLAGVASLSAGGDNYQSCAVLGTGATYCWGSNMYGQVGDGTSGTDRRVPVQVVGL